ncbi:Serine protease, subtilisin family [Micrococcales bacterium KH10]|nr:Serine protease, subtilisin family [Micrococcales bacterium KH10]
MRLKTVNHRVVAAVTAFALAVTGAIAAPVASAESAGPAGSADSRATISATQSNDEPAGAVAAETEESDNYIDGTEPVGTTDWLAQAEGRKDVFIQTTGKSALMALREAERRGARVSSARSTARGIASTTVRRTDRIVAAVQALDPGAFVLYESQYTIPGVAMNVSSRTLRHVTARADVVTIVELPYMERPKAVISPPGVRPANAASADLLKAIEAWRAGNTGRDVVVAVADSGFDYTHAHFGGAGTVAAYNTAKADPGANPQPGWYDSNKIVGMVDLANQDNNPIPTGNSDHGTHVAGIVAGWGVNTNGTRFDPSSYSSVTASQVAGLRIGPGMAPDAKLWPIKIFADGSGGTSLGVASIEYVAQQVADGNRIDIINQSIGADWGQIDNTYQENALAVLNQSGVIAVISQGNGGDYVDVGGSPGISERALTVASADKQQRISGFSSRGAHGSYYDRVKPDLTAIGSGVVSATSGTGSNSNPANGTSMSAPMAAGAAAVAIQAHDNWRGKNDNAALRFKALMMNTASSSLTDSEDRKYALTRTGTGLINTADAAKSKVWLSSDENGHLVTASFGVVEVSKPTTLTRTVTVRNDGTSAATFNTGYVPFTTTPGVNFATSPAQITVPAGGTSKVTVTLSIPDPLALRRTYDPTMSPNTSHGHQRQLVTEASGILDLQSTDPANVPWLRLGVYAAPKPATEIAGQNPVFDGEDPLRGRIRFGGTGLDFGNESFNDVAHPLSMGFQWGITDDNNNVPQDRPTRRSADTDLVGAATNSPELAERSNGTLYFAISGRGNRPRPVTGLDSVSAAIELTTEFNNQKYRLELVQPKNQGSAEKDDRYIVRTIRESDGAVVETQSVNGYDAHWDTNAFDNNVWILTVNLKNIGFSPGHSGSTKITYKARLIADGLNDDTGTITYDVYNPDVWFERPQGFNSHFVKSIAGTDLVVHRKSQDTDAKVLLVHMHNVSGTRTQVLDVQPDQANSVSPPVISGLPRVGQTLSASTGEWTGAGTFTYAYQWLRDGQTIAAATGASYAVAAEDEGKAISVRVTATRGTKTGTATSASVMVHDGSPVATQAPSITGTPRVGSTLSVNRGTWLDADGATYSYQWLRDGQAIPEATGESYLLAEADENSQIAVRVVATLSGRSGEATSAAVTVEPYSTSPGGGSDQEPGQGGNTGQNSDPGQDGGDQSDGTDKDQTKIKSGTALKSAKKPAKVKVKVFAKQVRAGNKVKIRVKVRSAGKAAKGKIVIRVGKKRVKVVKLKKGKRVLKIRLSKIGRNKIKVRYRGTKKIKAKRSKVKVVRVMRAR